MCIYHLQILNTEHEEFIFFTRYLNVSLYLPIWPVCVIVQTGSKCSLWRTKCAGSLEAGTGSVLVRLSDRYPGKAHLNPRCSGENSLYRYRCTGEMHTTGRNPSVLMSGITLFYSEEMNAHVQQNKYSGTSDAIPPSERAV